MGKKTLHGTPLDYQKELEGYLERFEELDLIKKMLTRLREDLPAEVTYHSVSHTEEVFYEALLLGLMDGVEKRDLELLAIAAVYHDSGFLVQMKANERIGADCAADAMTKVGRYSAEDIALVEQMIMDTRMLEVDGARKQVPTTSLSKYLLDADMGNLGRADFFEKCKLERQESGLDPDVGKVQLRNLMEAHEWHSDPALLLRQRQKERNLKTLSA